MSTNKTVNVTTGKVLHYTISKEGYKTVSGSKLITADTTLNINMIPTTSTDGVYTLGDRIGGVATFFTYFDSVNPNTSATQKYAVFLLDSTYRCGGFDYTYWGNYDDYTDLPLYNVDGALAAKESATYNTQTIFDTRTVGTGSNQFPAFYYARNPGGQALTVLVDGTYYVPQLLNLYELYQVYTYRTQLDAADPTVSSNASLSLNTLFTTQGIWSSNPSNYNYAGYANVWAGYNTDKWFSQANKGNNLYVVPVFEIPVN